MTRIQARIMSLGGGLFGGMFAVLLVVLWIVVRMPISNVWIEGVFVLFLLGMAAYGIDGASESLELQDHSIVFDGWLTHRRTIPLQGISQVLLVHEGLNSEWGIETLTFTRTDGEYVRLSLGPCWRRKDLEAFLSTMEASRGKNKLVEEVR